VTSAPLVAFNLLYVRPGYAGGTVRYAYELLRQLHRVGHHRYLVYAQAGVFPRNDPELRDVQLREVRVRGGLAGRVLVEHLILPVLAAKDGVDLLFSPGFVSPVWGRFSKIVTIHDLYYRTYPGFVRPWQRRYWRVAIPLSLRRADAAIVVSDATRRDVAKAFPWCESKLHRVHPGADALAGAPACSAVPPVERFQYCLVVGNVTPNKDIQTAVAAMRLLRSRGACIDLVIAGSDPLGLLDRELGACPADAGVRFMRRVPDVELAQLYAAALCLIQASRYEGFGLPVVEAMHCGCPVVASDIAVFHETAGDAALYFEPGSAASLSARIEQLARDPSLGARLRENGHVNARRFRWRDSALHTANLFDRTLQRRVAA